MLSRKLSKSSNESALALSLTDQVVKRHIPDVSSNSIARKLDYEERNGEHSLRLVGNAPTTVHEWSLAEIATRGAKRWPDAIAISDGKHDISFAELDRRVKSAALRLAELGVEQGERVAVLGRRRAGTVVALLAVAKLGATYVALDPSQPPERLRLLIEDADVCAVVAEDPTQLVPKHLANWHPTFTIDELSSSTATSREATTELDFANVPPHSVAYILYTSGSTGIPKGVQIEHRNILAFFEAHNARTNIGPGDRCLSTGPFYFDVSVMDVLLPLHFGATVFFAPSTMIPSLVLGKLSRHKITHFYAVGTLLALITGDGHRLDGFDLNSLKVLQTGAEVCNVRVANAWLERYPELRFLNSYGPTEATVGCISYLKPHPGAISGLECPIGKPHRGTVIRLLRDDGALTSGPGIVGELVVAGPQVMRGYWRRPVEDARAVIWLEGIRYYRTGDYGYSDHDGNFYFVGRRDDEIKLCGFRIHLNEIRAGLTEDPRVVDVVTGVVTTRIGREVAAAMVLAGRYAPESIGDIVASLRRRLPHYMIPTRWAVLGSFPCLASGKSDRKAIMHVIEQFASTSELPCYVENSCRP